MCVCVNFLVGVSPSVLRFQVPSALGNLDSAVTLNMSHNSLKSVPNIVLSTVTQLDLSHNSIQTLESKFDQLLVWSNKLLTDGFN